MFTERIFFGKKNLKIKTLELKTLELKTPPKSTTKKWNASYFVMENFDWSVSFFDFSIEKYFHEKKHFLIPFEFSFS